MRDDALPPDLFDYVDCLGERHHTHYIRGSGLLLLGPYMMAQPLITILVRYLSFHFDAVTMNFYRFSTPAYRERVDRYFELMRTPVDFKKEIGEEKDNLQARTLGRMCFVYGGFIALLALIPNPITGRLCFLFCAACIGGIGFLLNRASKAKPGSA